MASTASFVQKVGTAVKKVAQTKASNWWYTSHMAAASRAIAERIPVVDLVLDVRDARIPLSSVYEELRSLSPSSRRIIVLNKMDLADRSQTKAWMKYFEDERCKCFGTNSHNKENVKEFLNFLQARVRELKEVNRTGNTITLMLVGIPNVGKSALANSLHQIGRISAAEKGKLKHAIVSPQPGETKAISSLKIASHPNIYILDTPGVLPPVILDAEVCSKLALTGAINDCLVGDTELAQYALAIINSSKEYSKWERLSVKDSNKFSTDLERESSVGCDLVKRRRRQNPSDHTQDFVVNNVRRTIFDAISSFAGELGKEEDMVRLIEAELKLLQQAFHLSSKSEEDGYHKVAVKLLNLYSTGRLGHYTLDSIPNYL